MVASQDGTAVEGAQDDAGGAAVAKQGVAGVAKEVGKGPGLVQLPSQFGKKNQLPHLALLSCGKDGMASQTGQLNADIPAEVDLFRREGIEWRRAQGEHAVFATVVGDGEKNRIVRNDRLASAEGSAFGGLVGPFFERKKQLGAGGGYDAGERVRVGLEKLEGRFFKVQGFGKKSENAFDTSGIVEGGTVGDTDYFAKNFVAIALH